MRGADGFTLIEVLIVIAILALVGGLIFPRVDRLLDRARFASAQSVVAAAARVARAEALRTDTIVLLQPAPDGSGLMSNGRSVAALPAPVRVQGGAEGMRFYGDGSATGGVLRVVDGRYSAELQVLAPTGITQWRR